MDLWHILWDIGIIKFNDNGPRLITKPPLRKEPQLCPADIHQRRNSANAATPKGFTAARTNHPRTAAHPAASLNAAANPTNRRNHEEVPRPLPDRRLRVAGCGPRRFFYLISLTHTLRIDLLFGLRYF